MSDEQHEAWIRLIIFVVLVAACVACAIAGQEVAAALFGVGVFWLVMGVI